MEEEYNKEGKLLHATTSRTLRELVAKANKLLLAREDIISVLEEKGSYVLLYYYKGL